MAIVRHLVFDHDDLESQRSAVDYLTKYLRDRIIPPDTELDEIHEFLWHLNNIVSFTREVVGHYPDNLTS